MMFEVPYLNYLFELLLFGRRDDRGLHGKADRLNHFVTAGLLLFFCLVISARQYVGSAMQCWFPQEYSGSWMEYVHDYCFIQNTYYVAFNDTNVSDDEVRIGYYQWIPLFLALQGLCFMVPQWLWGTLNGVTGFNVSDFHSDALYLASMPHNGEKHAKELDKQSHNLLECLVMQIDTKGYFVTSLYMVIKALYLINVFAQFFIINAIIGAGSQIWGLDAFWNMMKGESWEELGLFPRVTFCDYVVRHMGNTQRNTVQCVLMLNMFNEKIYMFLWFWLIFVMTVNITSFITNFKLLGSEKERIQMCEGWIDYTKIPEEHRRLSNKFVRNMLKADGALLFHFIQSKAGTAVTKELITGVFENYLDMIIPKIVKPLTSDDSGNEKEEKNDDVKSITSETEANSLIPKTPMDRFEVPKPDMDLSDVEEPSLDVKGMKIDPIL